MNMRLINLMVNLFGPNVFLVGGCVRDGVLERKPKDWDFLVHGRVLGAIQLILAPFGQVKQANKSFPVLLFRFEGTDYEIAVPRTERSTGAGHKDFNIQTGVTPDEDASRRDFTINAMRCRLIDGQLEDPFGGVSDCKLRTVRAVGNPAHRFIEDPLRMLRAIRFAGQLDFTLDLGTFDALRQCSNLIQAIAPERVREELTKILATRHPSRCFYLMQSTGLLDYLIPELSACWMVDQNRYHIKPVFDHIMAVVDNTSPNHPAVRLAALLHDIAKPQCKTVDPESGAIHFYDHDEQGAVQARIILERLRYDTETIDQVCLLVREHMAFTGDGEPSARHIRRFIHRVGKNNVPAMIMLLTADALGGKWDKESGIAFQRRMGRIIQELDYNPPTQTRDLAVTGHDVMTILNCRPGPLVGSILADLMEQVLDNPELNTKEQLIDCIKSSRRRAS